MLYNILLSHPFHILNRHGKLPLGFLGSFAAYCCSTPGFSCGRMFLDHVSYWGQTKCFRIQRVHGLRSRRQRPMCRSQYLLPKRRLRYWWHGQGVYAGRRGYNCMRSERDTVRSRGTRTLCGWWSLLWYICLLDEQPLWFRSAPKFQSTTRITQFAEKANQQSELNVS